MFLGDVVGEPGRKAVIGQLASLRKELKLDFIIVNGENAAGGRGITPKITIDLLRAGAAVVTTGDHVWDQQDIVDYFPTEPRLLRPINYPEGTPGEGWVVLETAKGKIAVMQAQGRSFIQPPLENPFIIVEAQIEKLRSEGIRMIFLDFHAETTSEKIAMGWALDGKASMVVGTHTHVQTADERILPQGTGCLTDAGMCGPEHSVLGRTPESVVWRFRTGMPTRFPVARGVVRLCGVVADLDPESGRCLSIERVNRLIEPQDGAEGGSEGVS
ncbi:TIGR00282 family metallophosphoesterase [Haloferula sp.]|uniref:TIGR00282 family metallophosphoesterase n=1 Tax=Haloferula sp. TaxID=2497595 RepID=UPI003C783F19